MLPYLTGVANNEQDGRGCCLNFILSNGDKSHNGKSVAYIHIIPDDIIKRTKYVDTAYGGNSARVAGFRFRDGEKTTIFGIGDW